MSILINGMEMPENCGECRFMVDGWCYGMNENYGVRQDSMIRKPDWCPLEESPETHDKRTETHSCDLIERQAAIDAIIKADYEFTGILSEPRARRFEQTINALPSAQPKRKEFNKMSDAEFEEWLYEQGICHPNIHEPIPCSVVPLLIDNAINELPSAQPDLQPTCIQLATDCISRQAAIDECNKRGAEHVGYAIAQLPSAQPELIRCKDCIHYHEDVWGDEIGIGKPYDSIIVGHNGCDKWCGDKKDMVFTSSEGYCFLAERREDV